MLIFYLRQGMIVDKNHKRIYFIQSLLLEKYINFITQKRNKAKREFENDFYKILRIASYGRTMKNVRKRIGLELFNKDDTKNIIKQQSKLIFKGTHKSSGNCVSYTFKQNEVLIDKPIYLGFAILKLNKLHKYETYFDKLQPYVGPENNQLHYIDTDAFVLSVNTEDIITDLKNLENIIDFSNLDENPEEFSKKKEKSD